MAVRNNACNAAGGNVPPPVGSAGEAGDITGRLDSAPQRGADAGGRERPSPVKVSRYSLTVISVWTVAMVAMAAWNISYAKESSLTFARFQADAVTDRDQLYRRWNADLGGVYAAVTDRTPPNPHLANIPERDITTPQGRKLTLLNPAYMTRLVGGLAERQGQLPGHLTSLKPRRPENAPDTWESDALRQLEKDPALEQVSSEDLINGISYLRSMRPFYVVQGCLKCHADQGYRIGDLRGGLSVSVPLQPFDEVATHASLRIGGGYAAVWLFGLGVLWTVGRKLSRNVRYLSVARTTAETANARLTETKHCLEQEILVRQNSQIELNRSERCYRALFDDSHDALMTLAPPAWQFTSVNPATLKMFGVKDEAEFVTLTPQDLSPETQPDGSPSAEKAMEMIQTAMRAGSHSFEWNYRRIDGKIFPASVLLTRIEMEEQRYLQATVRDITERKQAEEELQQRMDEVERFNRQAVGREDRMIELKREVNEMARKAGVAPPYDTTFAESREGVIGDEG
jgi:PAS domain S-box-containing protein